MADALSSKLTGVRGAAEQTDIDWEKAKNH